jgi:hypothetical protein
VRPRATIEPYHERTSLPCSRTGRFHSAFFRRAAGRFLAERTAADAAAAFFALAVRSAGVIVSSERLPPIAPPLLPCLRKYASTSGGNFLPMPSA